MVPMGALAADMSDSRAPSTESRVPSPAYVFVTGDVIEITVRPQEGYDRTLTIQPDGKIVFPVVGEVPAAGMTVLQLQERLQQGLRVELKRPRVTVSLKEINKGLLRRVSVLGAVKSPGVYELKEQSTIAEMLATAGGPSNVADLQRVTISRAADPRRADGGKKQIVDLSQASRTGEVSQNIVLEPGDLIIVPEGILPTVLMLGEVSKPGSYELQGEMRLLDVLSMAGGPTPKANLRLMTLTRAGEQQKMVVDLQELLTKGHQTDLSKNVVMLPGDTVVLPENENKYYIFGEVNKSEAYALKPNDRLLDAITNAGGATKEADLTKVMLIRRGEDGKPIPQTVDLKKMLRKGDLAKNEALKEGDIIFIPDRKRKRSIGDLATLLYPVSGLLGILRY
jgi:protein involved in polysaccharide export with SLBB domain